MSHLPSSSERGFEFRIEVFTFKASEIIVLAFMATWAGSLFSSLKILLFLSNQIFQQINLGIHIQTILRRYFLLRSNGDKDSHLLRSSEVEVGRLEDAKPISRHQASLENSQDKRRCAEVSSSWKHRGQREGPSHPLLLRLSKVKMLLWVKVQTKRSTLGIEGKFQSAFHGPGLGGTQGIPSTAL